MKIVKCNTQAELDAALKDPNIYPELVGNEWFDVSGLAQVTAYDSVQVRASDSAQVTAYGSAQVRASDSAQVTASGSAQVRASDSAQVTASGSAQVWAYGSAQVRASDSAQVTASKHVAVTKHGKKTRVKGGVQIDFKNPQNLDEWFDEYELKAKSGIVILYKAVGSDFRSERGGDYTPGTTPESDSWSTKEECGHGLHFCGTPYHALGISPNAKRFVGCPVRVDSIAHWPDGDYPQKVKAPRVVKPGCFEVDLDGNPIGGSK